MLDGFRSPNRQKVSQEVYDLNMFIKIWSTHNKCHSIFSILRRFLSHPTDGWRARPAERPQAICSLLFATTSVATMRSCRPLTMAFSPHFRVFETLMIVWKMMFDKGRYLE